MWLTGSLGSSTWQRTLPISLLVVVCVPVTAWIAFRLLASLLGPDTATALGQNTRATQVVLLGLSVALAAVAVAASGPIGFVAFVAPQVALRLTGSRHRRSSRRPSPGRCCSSARTSSRSRCCPSSFPSAC